MFFNCPSRYISLLVVLLETGKMDIELRAKGNQEYPVKRSVHNQERKVILHF